MNSEKLIEKLYLEDGLRNSTYLATILDDNFEFEWDSSIGFRKMSKKDVLEMADELKANYNESKITIKDIISSENKIVVRYTHHVSTIENPNELFIIAKVIVIWEFENNQISRGYQISKPE